MFSGNQFPVPTRSQLSARSRLRKIVPCARSGRSQYPGYLSAAATSIVGVVPGKKQIVEIIARKTVFRALPALARIARFEKSPSAGDKIQIFAPRRAADVANVQIVDAAAHVLPVLAAVEAATVPAVLQTDVKTFESSGWTKMWRTLRCGGAGSI